MTFLAVLGALLAERYFLPLQHLRTASWFTAYFDWHQSLPAPASWRAGVAGYIGLILLPVGLTAAAQYLLAGHLFGVPGLIFGILALVYCLGPLDLDTDVKALLTAEQQGDAITANALAGRLLIAEPTAPGGEVAALCEGVMIRANRRIFAVLFWFLLLGPSGAMLYRFSRHIARLAQEHTRPLLVGPTAGALWLLDWLPARATAAGYALAGCFEGAVSGWRDCSDKLGLAGSEQLLGCVGIGALTHRDGSETPEGFAEVRRSMEMVWRTLALWLILLGLVTVSAWL